MAPELFGPWEKHPMSSLINQSNRLRRCGGRFMCEGDRIYRIAQDCNGCYGKRVFKVPVLELSPTAYREGRAELVADRQTRPRYYKHTYNVLHVGDKHLEVIDAQCPGWKKINEVSDILMTRIRKRLGR